MVVEMESLDEKLVDAVKSITDPKALIFKQMAPGMHWGVTY